MRSHRRRGVTEVTALKADADPIAPTASVNRGRFTGGTPMKRRVFKSFLLCLAAGGILSPLMTTAQESPRTDPTAAAPDAAAVPPRVRTTPLPATTQPTTAPAGRFVALNGTEGFWRVGKD